jgi:hypothetical protein
LVPFLSAVLVPFLSAVLVPFLSGFLGCIFDLFLDAALLVRDVFQRTFQKLMGVLDPFCPRF